MGVDYDSIRAENKRRYGTDIGRIGPMLLADRYDDRAHFIYELLQNAEDALARRARSKAPRSITFALSPNALRVSHFGAPFTEADVLVYLVHEDGFLRVPVLVLGETVVRGYTEELYREALQEASRRGATMSKGAANGSETPVKLYYRPG